jgi:hypothetical protein
MNTDGSPLIDILWKLFIHRTDSYAVQNDDGTYVRIGKPETEWVRERSHLPEKPYLKKLFRNGRE